MNIILFEPDEISRPLPRSDERSAHILEVLRRQPGDTFDAGIVNGPRGKGILKGIGSESLEFAFEWTGEDPPLPPVHLIVGLSRPQTNRKILQDATSLGVARIDFVATERGEPSYASSKLWTTDEWRRHVVAGAVQAFSTRLPEVTWDKSLSEAINQAASGSALIGLDNYEATIPLAKTLPPTGPVVLTLGSERGWTGPERALLRSRAFALAHLGSRPLRTETAVVAALAICHAVRL